MFNKMKRFGATALLILQLSQFLYPCCGTVIKINRKSDTIKIKDCYGKIWTMKGVEDWGKGDNVAMLFFNGFTEDYRKDDVLIKIRYIG